MKKYSNPFNKHILPKKKIIISSFLSENAKVNSSSQCASFKASSSLSLSTVVSSQWCYLKLCICQGFLFSLSPRGQSLALQRPYITLTPDDGRKCPERWTSHYSFPLEGKTHTYVTSLQKQSPFLVTTKLPRPPIRLQLSSKSQGRPFVSKTYDMLFCYWTKKKCWMNKCICSLAVVRSALHHRSCDWLTNRGERSCLMMWCSLAWLVKGCEWGESVSHCRGVSHPETGRVSVRGNVRYPLSPPDCIYIHTHTQYMHTREHMQTGKRTYLHFHTFFFKSLHCLLLF